jgi:DNA recombination protein RmuC
MNANIIIGIGIGIGFITVLLALLILLIFQIRKIQGKSDSLSVSLQNLSQQFQQGENNTNLLIERISNLQQNQQLGNQTVGKVYTDLINAEKIITSEVGSVRRDSTNTLYEVGKGLSDEISKIRHELATEVNSVRKDSTTSLYQVGKSLSDEISKIQQELAILQTNTKARQEIEQKTAESISRLETIIAGTQSKGSAGENIVELIFAKLPVEWQVRNFKVNGRTVEFGLKFPNNLVLPIDSKWAATNLLEQFIGCDNLEEQQRLKTEIEKVVILKAKEVRKYIDPNITISFGVAVVPDAIYDICSTIYPEIFRIGVVLVSYSMFVPYLLLVFHTILKSEQSIDLQKLDTYLQTAQTGLNNLQEEINGRFSRALTMLNNSRDDMQAHISSVNSNITGIKIGTSTKNPQSKLPDATS